MKKKAMIMAVASLGSMALIGTGFAGWVISANTTATAGGVMAAFDVADHRLSAADGTWKNTGTKTGEIIFGVKEDASLTNHWFTFSPAAEETKHDEVLSDEYTFVVSSNETGDAGAFTVTSNKTKDFVVDADKKSAWDDAIAKKLVTVPEIKFDKTEYALKSGTATVVMTVTFAWGDHFKITDASTAVNPYTFYNTISATGGDSDTSKGTLLTGADTWADDAKEAMHALAQITQAGFTITAHVDRK